MMLSTIIERVTVFRDTIKLSFKLDIGSLLSTAGVTYNGVELFEDVAKPVSKVLTKRLILKRRSNPKMTSS
ncbi:hypothetical protein [Paenibacillus monticola]|uniref:Uncharacterized protein n=1 Tax=Paenibacillus monticola TaxID=2666075 RepID=A0A7X2H719_9BACL|nr:hypothetical protein [Paenibacillus monticola]MRN54734.1 hypothetical protein [Paenibacillus monticola]